MSSEGQADPEAYRTNWETLILARAAFVVYKIFP